MPCGSQLFRTSPVLAPVRDSLAKHRPMRRCRVHDLPDLVCFDQAIHVPEGVGCESCYGRVDRMQLIERGHPLTMRRCLDCHRAPQGRLRPRDAVFDR